VHGFANDLHTWDSLWDALGKDVAAVRYDLRGFGRSSPTQSVPFTHADDLLAILDESAIEQCDLVGVSMGGSIALNFALDHPERVGNLVLISPGLVGWEWSDAWLKLWQPIVDRARRGALDEARRLWWEHPLFGTTRKLAASSQLYESIMRYPGTQWIGGEHHRPMLPDLERLHLLRSRTLLLTGGLDFEDFRLIADLIEANVADVRRSDDPALGHLVHLEDPRGCAGKIRSFLRMPGDLKCR
jgi:pimeloyl-ACP methyl ester carboxylesterase